MLFDTAILDTVDFWLFIADESETSYCNLLKRLNKMFNWENAVTSITKDESIGEVKVL